MTIKEAFEKLHKAVKSAGLNPFFIINNLKEEFKDIAANVDEGGSVVEVEPAQESGFLVGNIKVDGEDNYLFAPAQPPTPDIYSTAERLVGVLFHDNISEDIYEKSYFINQNISNGGYSHFDSGLTNANYGWVTNMCFSITTNSRPLNSYNGLIPDIEFSSSVGMSLDNHVGRDINRIFLTVRYIKNS